jgi:rRNA maturation protein Rpf1
VALIFSISIAQSHKLATQQSCNLATQQSRNLALQQSRNLATQQSCNLVTQQSRNLARTRNQHDYIFFRHHRYEFKNAEKVKLRELGPRFMLRLRSLQKGTFDSINGEYEWIKARRRHELEQSRCKFYL